MHVQVAMRMYDEMDARHIPTKRLDRSIEFRTIRRAISSLGDATRIVGRACPLPARGKVALVLNERVMRLRLRPGGCAQQQHHI